MLDEARYQTLKERMQAVKGLYLSRHYTRCAKYGEQLLGQVKSEIHPIHLAYLNFYTALSHDTLAREATLKNRYHELSLAEKHYMAAIAALTTPGSLDHDDPLSSPTSSTADEETIWRLRRSSDTGSFDSTTSSATSYSTTHDYTDTMNYSPSGSQSYHFEFPQPPRDKHTMTPKPPKHTIITITSERPETPEEHQVAADTAAFARMLRFHLADVLKMKDRTSMSTARFSSPAVSSPRYSPPVMSSSKLPRYSTPLRMSSPGLSKFSSPAMASPSMFRPGSSLVRDEHPEVDVMRQSRQGVRFRERFDPSSVQRLCSEALAELE